MTCTQSIWYMLVQWLIAVGTIGAVGVALFGDLLRAKFFPPMFRIDVLKLAGELCPITDPQGHPVAVGRYYHLNVNNTRAWLRPATHSQLRLIRIEEPGPDHRLQITFDGDIPVRRRHQEVYPTESVIGTQTHYDLCGVIHAPNRPPVMTLMPIVRANNLPIEWKGDTHFVASFQLKCSERDSQIVRIQVDWDGTWHDGDAEIKQHLILRKID